MDSSISSIAMTHAISNSMSNSSIVPRFGITLSLSLGFTLATVAIDSSIAMTHAISNSMSNSSIVPRFGIALWLSLGFTLAIEAMDSSIDMTNASISSMSSQAIVPISSIVGFSIRFGFRLRSYQDGQCKVDQHLHGDRTFL